MQFGAIKIKFQSIPVGNIRCDSLPIIDDMFHANVCIPKQSNLVPTVASEIVFAKRAKNSMVWLD